MSTKPEITARPKVEDCLCFGTRLAARRLTEFYEARLAPHGVNLPQFGLLGAIGSMREASISDIARRLELDPSTLSRTLRPLEEGALIEMFADPSNLRVRRVRLTAEGKAVTRKAAEAWAQAQREASEIVSPALIAQLVERTAKLRG